MDEWKVQKKQIKLKKNKIKQHFRMPFNMLLCPEIDVMTLTTENENSLFAHIVLAIANSACTTES